MLSIDNINSISGRKFLMPSRSIRTVCSMHEIAGRTRRIQPDESAFPRFGNGLLLVAEDQFDLDILLKLHHPLTDIALWHSRG